MAVDNAAPAAPTQKPPGVGNPKATTPSIGIEQSQIIPQNSVAAQTPEATQSLAPEQDQGPAQSQVQAPASSSKAQSSSSSHLTFSSSEPSSASASAARESTVSSQPSRATNNDSTGLIAGIAVLAVLLAVALAAVAFLILRNKRKPSKHSQYEPSYEQKTPLDPSSTVGLESLESDVKNRDHKIRELQAVLLKQGRGEPDIDDRQIRDRYAALSQGINDWVMTYCKGQDFTSPMSPRTVSLLQKVAPAYQGLLRDPRMKYLVVRAIVIENIAEAFIANEFIGSIPFNELAQGFNRYASPDKAKEWRALTVSLLRATPDFNQEKASSVQEITRKIETMITEVAHNTGTSTSCTRNLQTIVDTAADLSVDLAQQQASYFIGPDQVGGMFESDNMEDVSQADAGRGRTVQAIVFPSLKKVMRPSQQVTVLSKAQVIV